jgi:hypothetical protein
MGTPNFKRIWLRVIRLLAAAFFFYGASVCLQRDGEVRGVGAICILAGFVTLWAAFFRRRA